MSGGGRARVLGRTLLVSARFARACGGGERGGWGGMGMSVGGGGGFIFKEYNI